MNDSSSSSEEEAEPSSQQRGCLGKGTRRPAGKGKAIWAGCANAKKAPTTTAEPFYYEYEAAEDLTQFGRCNVSVITDQAQKIVINLLFYTAAAWVPFWAFLAIAVNISFRQFGHHRWLDFYQELGFILLFPFMGVFVLMPQLELLCLITTMVLLFFLVFILVIGFLQAYFASSLIKGTSLKDGRLPVAVNYVWPLALAAVPVGVSMWLLRSDIGTNRVHCFAPIYSNLFWAFVVPAWLLWWLMLIRNQLSITACKQSRPNVDRVQLYWARKSVKGTPILLCWFLLTFFTQLFAVDMQLLWLCVLFTAESLVLGPLLFLLHTHNHQRVNNGIFERTQMGLYRPCPVRRQPVATGPGLPPPPPPPPPPAQTTTLGPPEIIQQTVVPSPAVPLPAPAPRPQTLVQTVQLPPVGQPMSAPIPQGQQTAKKPTEKSKTAAEPGTTEAGGGGEANAQLFYEWLTDTDERNLQESERVLWPPRPV